MNFVKQNLISVISVVLAVIAIPVMIFFSSGWNAKIKKDLEDNVGKAVRSLNDSTVQYSAPTAGEDGRPFNVTIEPTQLRNESMRELLERLADASDSVREAYEERNSAGKALLVDDHPQHGDLFPIWNSESARVALLTQIMSAYPDAHDSLLEDNSIRSVPAAEQIASQVEGRRTRLQSEILSARVSQQLTAEELESIAEELSEFRRGLYRQHASETAIYATPDVFSGVVRLDPETGLVTHEEAWEWQHKTWFHSDIIAALLAANGGESVLDGPVKRIIRIAIEPQVAAAPSGGSARGRGGRDDRGGGGMDEFGGGGGAAAGGGSLATLIAPDYTQSFTGLAAWPERPNPLYDLRYADIDLVVDGNRISEVLEAIAAQNLMHVVDMDLREYDANPDRMLGYYYGSGAPTALSLRVSSAWLRSWMKRDMPESVRSTLGIPADAPQQPSDAAGFDGDDGRS